MGKHLRSRWKRTCSSSEVPPYLLPPVPRKVTFDPSLRRAAELAPLGIDEEVSSHPDPPGGLDPALGRRVRALSRAGHLEGP